MKAPLLADGASLTDSPKDKIKADRQAKKVNEIITSMYDDFKLQVTQKQKRKNTTFRCSSYKSELLSSVKDVCYNEFANISFTLATRNIAKDAIIPLLRLDKCNGVVGSIQFMGMDDADAPMDSLANYGVFIITRNEIIKETQLSYYATADTPNKDWKCSLQFIMYDEAGELSDLSVIQVAKKPDIGA